MLRSNARSSAYRFFLKKNRLQKLIGMCQYRKVFFSKIRFRQKLVRKINHLKPGKVSKNDLKSLKRGLNFSNQPPQTSLKPTFKNLLYAINPVQSHIFTFTLNTYQRACSNSQRFSGSWNRFLKHNLEIHSWNVLLKLSMNKTRKR